MFLYCLAKSITDKNIPLQSGSVIYEHAKLIGAQYKHTVIFTEDGCISTLTFTQF